MADYYQLVVEKRESIGSAANKFLRRNGKVPANYYYKETDNINLILDSKNLYHALHSGHHIFEVEVEGDTQYVMIKEIQFPPVQIQTLLLNPYGELKHQNDLSQYLIHFPRSIAPSLM